MEAGFLIGFISGGIYMIVINVIEYFMHKKNKLCYHCGKPYKEQN